MCGRVTLTLPDLDEVAADLEARVEPSVRPLYKPRYNGAPTDQLWMAENTPQGRVLLPAVWGFHRPSGVQINARSETAERLLKRPVIVPADGFYEWKGEKKDRHPVWFRPKSGKLLYMAGLARELPDGRPCFVILTTEASGPVAQLHDRMPVLLDKSRLQTWLEQPDTGLLVPAPPDFLTATDVSDKVNNVRNDDPSVLQPPEAPKPKRQLTLF
jgi:putative SOS response-associated peptidase YedK